MAGYVKPNLEHILHEINKKFINIDNDRQAYASHFMELRDVLFKKLRENYPPFGSLFNGFQLGGSYGDNLKVTKPNEFDVVFHIRFPHNQFIIVQEDNVIVGNVQLNMRNVLTRMSTEKQNAILYSHLKKWINDDDYLIINKIQSYFVSCFHKALYDMDHKIIIRNVQATLKYKRQGPAHTIYVSTDNNNNNQEAFMYSVDFVPGILLDKSQSILPLIQGQWEAIPKPIHAYALSKSLVNKHQHQMLFSSISFRASYYREEQKLIKDMNNLKSALRMMKKFRDAHSNMQKMKSYFIKTLFLWKIKEHPDDSYRRASLYTILIDMFGEMEKSLNSGVLRFYWHPEFNLYESYSENLLMEMAKCVRHSRNILINANNGLILPSHIPRCIQRIFLRSEEYRPRPFTGDRFPPITETNENVEEEYRQPIQQGGSQSFCTIL